MRRVLSVRADHFGVVFEDAAVPQAVEDGVPLMDAAPQSVAAVNIATLAERIVDHWDRTLDDSEQRLLNHTQTFLAGMDEEAAEVPSPEAA
jgi:MinD-like ATPase involved in chromosome partitioning or flagellar assembly